MVAKLGLGMGAGSFVRYSPNFHLTHTRAPAPPRMSRHKTVRVAYLTLQCLITLITPAEIFDKRSFITACVVLPLSSHNMAATLSNCLEESHFHYHI